MVRFYGAGSPASVMQWPLRLFWSAATHVDRLEAHTNLGLMDVYAAAGAMGSGEAFQEIRQGLIERLGTTVVHEAPRTARDEILEFSRLINGE